MKRLISTRLQVVLAAAAVVTFAQSALSHEHGSHDGMVQPTDTEGQAFGRKGDPKKVSRTIEIGMSDAMRFAPAQLVVKQGETVRFRLKNFGKVMHEMVLGTMKELKEHAEIMKQHPSMHHAEPNMVHVAPGKTRALVWQFTNPGEFHYGCLVPGHFEAGMVGKINVAP